MNDFSKEELDLVKLAKNNFLKEKVSPFKVSIRLSDESIMYLLINNGYDLGLATAESF